MTKLGGKKHLKRLAAPKLWPIPRKVGGWFTIKPEPGPHPKEMCLPLGIILRDLLGYARTLREIKIILNQELVEVDGRVRKSYKFPVGPFDVIHIKRVNEYYRILPHRNKLILHKITAEEARFKLCKIIGKRYYKNGWIQLNLTSGYNILFKTNTEEERRKVLNTYFTNDTLKVSLPDLQVLNHYRFEKGAYCYIMAGRHMGEHGKLIEIRKHYGIGRASTATIETPDGERIVTALDYVFIIGRESPEISLPTEEEWKKLRRWDFWPFKIWE